MIKHRKKGQQSPGSFGAYMGRAFHCLSLKLVEAPCEACPTKRIESFDVVVYICQTCNKRLSNKVVLCYTRG